MRGGGGFSGAFGIAAAGAVFRQGLLPIAAVAAEELAKDALREGHAFFFAFDLAEGLALGHLPGGGKAGRVDHHLLFGAGHDLEVALELVVGALVEAGDLEAEVLAFLGETGALFIEVLDLAGVELELIAEVAAVAFELALGLPMGPKGEREEDAAEEEAHDKGVQRAEEGLEAIRHGGK